ncbi:type II secretion system protein [Massilia sp. H6]|uniref:type II secretion system protein n=1 Tax=Massilia sp. H6 TaxID=2970464 RepID=UPI002169C69C|nr:type II secretion system protein [Massilia sp. H6]UVW29959.1 type II secretion system GspH family protein [Massilia sp. H6]
MLHRALRRQAGFTYLGLIIFVFIVGMVGAATLKVESLLRRAQAETELLETGAQFAAALKSYAEATPRGQPPQPLTLQELLRDPRFPNPRRHLRKIFVDPVTGQAEWGLVRAGDGGRILGVHSLSQAQPLKLAKFDARFPNFENKRHLADWKFMATGQGALTPAAPGTQPGMAPPQPIMAPPPEAPSGPVAAPVAAQAPMQEVAPPARAEPEPASEPAPEPEPEPAPQPEPEPEPPAPPAQDEASDDSKVDPAANKDEDDPKEPPARESGR